MKKKQNINIILVTALIICITIIVGIVVIWMLPEKNDTNAVSEAFDDQGNPVIKIETPYCTLSYPAKWSDNLRHEGKTENGIYTHTFYGIIKEKEFKLFDVHFGAKDKGSFICYVINDGEAVPFNVVSYNVFENAEFNEAETMILSAMLDAVNTVIDSVIASPNYIG